MLTELSVHNSTYDLANKETIIGFPISLPLNIYRFWMHLLIVALIKHALENLNLVKLIAKGR